MEKVEANGKSTSGRMNGRATRATSTAGMRYLSGVHHGAAVRRVALEVDEVGRGRFASACFSDRGRLVSVASIAVCDASRRPRRRMK
jgi:hypothetical protein